MPRTSHLLLAGALLAAVPACVIEIGDYSGPKVQKDVELSYTPSGQVREVFVDTYNGNVEITPGSGGTISGTSRIHARGRDEAEAQARLDSIRWNFDEEGGRVTARLSEPSSGGRNNAGGNAVLTVPAGVRVLVDTSNGAISVTGAFPYAFADTSNGAVTIDGAREVEADTSNGPVRIVGADGKVSADTSNGPLHYQGASADFTLDTSNGPITVVLTGDWSGTGVADTSNGAVSVTCAGRLDCSLAASTSNGKVRSPKLAGRGKLTLDTSNGSITVEHAAE